jgi:hypothetical protein
MSVNSVSSHQFMKKTILLAAICLFAAVASAQAQLFGVSVGHRGVSVAIGGGVCSAPAPVVYAQPPVYYTQPAYPVVPQAYYAQPPVVYSAPPVCAPAPVYVPGYYGYGYGPTVVIGGGWGRGRYGGYHQGYRGGWDHRGWRR